MREARKCEWEGGSHPHTARPRRPQRAFCSAQHHPPCTLSGQWQTRACVAQDTYVSIAALPGMLDRTIVLDRYVEGDGAMNGHRGRGRGK